MPFGQWVGNTISNIKEKIQDGISMLSDGRQSQMEQTQQPNEQQMEQFLMQLVMQHEGLEPLQTPFKITRPKMKEWTSMFDDTIKIELDPNAKKSKGRENFLYLKRQEDLLPAIEEQFRRYADNPDKYGLPENPTIAQAIKVFDQTGANNKIKFLEENGMDTTLPLITVFQE